MVLARLEISQLRNLQSAQLFLDPHLNLVIGPNGSGKTSVLEALFLLSTGRSFRSGRARRLVNDSASSCTVFASFSHGGSCGVRRHASGESDFHLDGLKAPSLVEMAKRLPLMLLDPGSSDLLDEGSKPRRALLDWGVFHVEHGFYPEWRRYYRALKQRNSLLRSGNVSPSEISGWDKELAESASRIDRYRNDYFQRWTDEWQELANIFLPGFDLTLEYLAGWDVERNLLSLLQEWRVRDLERGFTQQGPHRADVKVRLGSAPADEILSRGQKKLVICALKLSQAMMLRKAGLECVLLVDDLPSELDGVARARLVSFLAASGAQVLVTAIEPESLEPILAGSGKPFKTFHVEHGRVTEA